MEQENKIVPIRPGFVRELESHVEKSWDMANGGDSVTNELWSPELRAFLDGQTLKSLFFSEDWVFIAVDLIASKISSVPLAVMHKTEDGSEETVPDHPLNALMQQPNQWQDYCQWMYNTAVETTLMGNAVIWYGKRSGQLITLPTENISMDFDNVGAVESYIVSTVREDAGGYRELQGTQTFDPRDIIHVRRPNPSSLLWGLSPFVPGRKSVLFNRYSSDYLNAFYLKQATPGLALTLDRQVNEDVALRQLRSFEVAYQGRKNMRRTLILPKGVDAKALTHSLSDQNLIDHINQNRETICGLLKVPKHEVGLQTAGSLGSEEYKTALANFWSATLIPTMGFISGALTKYFQKELGEGNYFKFDTSDVEALKDDLKRKAETAEAMLRAGLSINEVRAKVWREEPVEDNGADKPFVLTQLASVQFTPALPPSSTDGQKALPQRSKLTVTPRVEQFRAAVLKQLDEEEARTIGELSKKAVDILVGMTEKAIDVILDSNKAMPIVTMKELPSRRTLARRIERALAGEFEEEWVTEIARTLSQSVDLGYDQQLSMVFNDEAKREIQALRARDSDKRRASLTARGLDSFSQISVSHTERIMKEIEKGQANNESITAIMRRVADALGTPGQLAGRAETIARTETLTAVSIGQAAAMDNAKEVIPGLKKAWLTAGDSRVRDSHKELDGEIVDADDTFGNGLRHPRDIKSGDPAEVINCFPAGVVAEALNLEKSYQRVYSGPMVTVYFKSGDKLTGTPNHPMLTSKGWVGLGSLTKGSKVFKARGFDSDGVFDLGMMKVNHIKSSIDKIFSASAKALNHVRKPLHNANFHGDGSGEYVDIVDMDRGLQDRIEPFTFEEPINFSLPSSNLAESLGLSFSRANQSLSRVRPTRGSVGGGDLLFSTGRIEGAPFNELSLTPTSLLKPGFIKPSDNGDPRDSKFFADLINGHLLVDVHFDDVIDIQIEPFFQGHVYNLQTNEGYYLANNFVSHNCRCTLLLLPPGENLELP